MDKQKLIEELECLEVPTDSLDYLKGADYANERAISLAKQLKESKKAVLPKSADEFIKEGLSMGADKVDIIGSAVSFSSAMPNDEFSLWFKSNRDLFVDALANGYEVENEPLYYVDVINDGAVHKRLILDHENGKHNIVGWSDNLIGLVQEMFTEQEIKAIDERYWPFAVKVDGE
ncbi:TPA: DUF1642 domain-containing protein [Enterococcus faecalis]